MTSVRVRGSTPINTAAIEKRVDELLARGPKALFTDDTRFAAYMDGEGSEPTYVLYGREALTPHPPSTTSIATKLRPTSTAKAPSPWTGTAP
jgi:hypothetical protein